MCLQICYVDLYKGCYDLCLQTHKFMLRRTQHLLKKILPESREFVLLLRKSPIQHALYRAFYHYAIGQVNAGESSFNPLKGFAICMKVELLILINEY
jgi:hypothetical protein